MSTIYIETPQINKIIRKQLKQHFPNTKFSVRKSPGNSVDIKWEDGPVAGEVEEITAWARGENFDPMTDMRTMLGAIDPVDMVHDPVVAEELAKISGGLDEPVRMSSAFVFVKRSYSDDALLLGMRNIEDEYKLTIPRDHNGLPSQEYCNDERCHTIGSGAMSWYSAVLNTLRYQTLA